MIGSKLDGILELLMARGIPELPGAGGRQGGRPPSRSGSQGTDLSLQVDDSLMRAGGHWKCKGQVGHDHIEGKV